MRLLYTVPDTPAFRAERNGYAPDMAAKRRPGVRRDPGTDVHPFTFSRCAPGGSLRFYAVGRGGHNWPGRPGLIPAEVAGTVSAEPDASRAIWTFFRGE